MIMKKNWKNRSGVSPVIATILMVAITVVLAAVLYVMVMGFGGSSSAPTAKLTASTASGASLEEKVEVTSISAATDFADMKVSLVYTAKGASTSSTYVATITSAGALSWTTAPSATEVASSITLVDLAGDKKISTGDYFMVTGITAGDSFTMNLLYGEDSTSIASASWTVA